MSDFARIKSGAIERRDLLRVMGSIAKVAVGSDLTTKHGSCYFHVPAVEAALYYTPS